MKIRITLFLLLFVLPVALLAQKKEISQARTILKNGKNPEQAEQLMTNLLKDSANQNDKRIYALWFQAVAQQYDKANERLYLHQNQDTAQFLALARRLFSIAGQLDTLDMRPDRRGRVDIEYRRQHAQQLVRLRPNLFNGGAFHFRKHAYPVAFDFFDTYIHNVHQPLFSSNQLDTLEPRLSEAAYWATLSAYRQHDPVLTLRHRHLALRDTAKAALTLQYIAEARHWLNDDSLYAVTLLRGFKAYPLNTYFFPRLMDFYAEHKEHEKALQLCDTALAIADTSRLFLFARATALFNLKRYNESLQAAEGLIDRFGDAMPDAYYLAGSALLNQALALDPLNQKKQLRKTYTKARPYMEHYRQLCPDQRQKWGTALYRIYLNLNLGRQFDEIDKLLKE